MSAALHLARAGLRVTVLEASGEIGGRARHCADSALVSEQDSSLLQIAEAFSGVEARALSAAPPLYLWKRQLRESEPVTGALPPALGLSRLRLARLARWLRRFGDAFDLAEPEAAIRYDDRSTTDFGALYFGRACARRYMAPWLAAHAPTRSDDTSRVAWLMLAASRARAGSAQLSLGPWSARPSTRFPIDVRCSAPVLGLSHDAGTSLFSLRVGGEVLRTRALVSTLAPPRILELAGDFFSTPERRILASLGGLCPLERLRASVRRLPGLPISGRYGAVRISEEESARFSSLLLDREERTLVATLRDTGRDGTPDLALAGEIERSLRGIRLDEVRVERIEEAIAKFPVGRYRALARLHRLGRRERARRLYLAGDWCVEASLEGAAQSGARAARDLLRDLELDRQAAPQPFLVEGL